LLLYNLAGKENQVVVYFFIVLFLMHILESITGFGSTSIGIPILSLALGTEASVALLSAAGLILCLVVAATQYKKVQLRELLIILAAVIPIMPIGYLLFAKLRLMEWALRLIMGLVVTFVASREIWRRMIRKDAGDPPQWLVYSAFGVGAVVQGMFSMGGALINVYVLTRIRDKSMFRATMVMVWLITNTISLMFRMFVLHSYTRQIWTNVLYSIPLVFIAFFIGNKLHHRIPNEKFANFVYIVQLISGLLSIAGGINLLM
jgi:uncharacterized membrane protein YfcA